MKRLMSIVLIMMVFTVCYGWGFYAHERINRMAVFTLPPEMIKFYKHNIQYLTEKAVNPDKRRYIMKEEAARHYIDLDVYGDSALYTMPRYWNDAVEKYTEDTLQAYGIVPWHINLVKYQLTQAMLSRDIDRILRYSADIGHYIGDANVPLHTTENYNGQLTGQYGIHGFWESRLPELFFEEYDLFVGKAEYIDNTQLEAWSAVEHAHLALDSVLRFEKELAEKFAEDKKYSFEERGAMTVRVYSYEFSEEYHEMLNGMVERQMRRAIKMVGDFWFTAWVDAGQPDLNELLEFSPAEEQLNDPGETPSNLRNHESGTDVGSK
ncbi:MAG: S1/P1 Nuclease [Flammeovirgaceae bacterium]|nr:S1/P1 Nuclease [Flammeovirgaceae bacterium]MBE61659.1 S1/P1 Nuclease [Flammeovirgaceae bacterium]MBR07998.1 S1/P1 Nuclease [Rickettsiales bacterium]HCX23026.1 S1/P1 Nuclease [Cytophagales bacterium]